jgi:hypothetical protein
MVCVVIVAYSWPGPLGRGGLLERRVFFDVNARLCHSYSYSRHLTPFGPHFTATYHYVAMRMQTCSEHETLTH